MQNIELIFYLWYDKETSVKIFSAFGQENYNFIRKIKVIESEGILLLTEVGHHV